MVRHSIARDGGTLIVRVARGATLDELSDLVEKVVAQVDEQVGVVLVAGKATRRPSVQLKGFVGVLIDRLGAGGVEVREKGARS